MFDGRQTATGSPDKSQGLGYVADHGLAEMKSEMHGNVSSENGGL